jgi:hypothetical protein
METSPDQYAILTNDQVGAEIERLGERIWDLTEQVAEARLARGALMNLVKQRQEAQLYGV